MTSHTQPVPRSPVMLVDAGSPMGLSRTLASGGFDVIRAAAPETALYEYGSQALDAVVISYPLPGMGATALCRELRRRGRTPLVVVTATEDDPQITVDVLASGADDVVALPCHDRVLHARLRALIRRSTGALSPLRVLRIGALTIRTGRGRLDTDPPLALTPLQVVLLRELAAHPGMVLDEPALRRVVQRSFGEVAIDSIREDLRTLRLALSHAAGAPDVLQNLPEASWRLTDTDQTG